MINKLKNSLTVKIFLITAGLLMWACALTYAFIAWAVPTTYIQRMSDELEEKSKSFVHTLSKATLEQAPALVERFALVNGVEVQLVDEEGGVAAEYSPPVEGNGSELGDIFAGVAVAVASDSRDNLTGQGREEIWRGENESYQISVSGLNSVTVSSMRSVYDCALAGEDRPFTLLVDNQLRGVNQAVEAMGRILPGLALVILAVSLAGACIYSRCVTRPIVRLSGVARSMAELDFGWQAEEKRSDEIGSLGRSLNGLSSKLSSTLGELREANETLRRDIHRERELERQRQEFFSAASHELKTPITIIKGQLEGMLHSVGSYRDRDKYLARSLEVAQTMEDMVAELLAVTRMEAGSFAPAREELDLAALTARQLELCGELLEQRSIGVSVTLEEAPALGDRALLARAVGNLLSNAAHYTPPGERVFVRTQSRDGRAMLVVENTGAHIPEPELPRLFEAFYRLEQSRNRGSGGSGLGLYLAGMIARRHGGSCALRNTAAGVEATLVI